MPAGGVALGACAQAMHHSMCAMSISALHAHRAAGGFWFSDPAMMWVFALVLVQMCDACMLSVLTHVGFILSTVQGYAQGCIPSMQ